MFGKSDTITEILGVEAAASTPQVKASTGSLLIRWRSGRRAEEVFIQHDAALALVAAIEEHWSGTGALHRAVLAAVLPPARAHS